MTPVRFFSAEVPLLLTTQASVPVGKQWIIKEIILTNTTGSDATVTVKLGGIDIVCVKNVPAYDVVILALSTVANDGDDIETEAGTDLAISATASGVEI